ncbi:YuzB family protein [Clostridium sp. CX1]|uniref:YuzB family protein n=1 Tax=Clostridium sp. CX1 TaxID=2978346 RepID=UPI0021BE3AC0|nr:YuzB family protein [Clostridium sp. CX1]MCT8975411.1 YuzB family protein [Clostridium sp. CX1]
MFTEIFFCENNVSKGLEEIVERLEEEYPDVIVYIEPCLGRCGQCIDNLYAVIDVEMIIGESPEELYKNIKKALEE